MNCVPLVLYIICKNENVVVLCRTLHLAILVFLCYLTKSVQPILNFIGVVLKSFYRYFFLNRPILQSKQLMRHPSSAILQKGCFVDIFLK